MPDFTHCSNVSIIGIDEVGTGWHCLANALVFKWTFAFLFLRWVRVTCVIYYHGQNIVDKLTTLPCIKYARICVFSRIRTYKTREKMAFHWPVFSLHRRMRVSENRYSRMFYAVLSKIGVSLKCFLTDIWHYILAQLSKFSFGWPAGNLPSISSFSVIFLKFYNFLTS